MQIESRSFIELFLDGITTLFIGVVYFLSLIFPAFIFKIIFSTLIIVLFPFIPETYLINRNIKLVMPEKCFFKRFIIILKVWINLAFFFAEYFYVYKYSEKKLKKLIEVKTDVLEEVKNNKSGKIFISGHFANWELALAFLSKILNQKINVIYRKSNNVFFENLFIQMFKKNNHNINMIAKQENAAFKVLRALKNNEIVIILMDQRDDKGMLVDFLGVPAYTNNSAYLFFKKMNVDLYYFCCLRKKNLCRFNFYGEKLNLDKNIEEIEFLNEINERIAKSIKMSLRQWFWVHNRWKIRNISKN